MSESKTSEPDVERDQNVARSRETGGRRPQGDDDEASTTGTTEDEEYVGRIAGDDPGYAGETGAEARQAGAEGD